MPRLDTAVPPYAQKQVYTAALHAAQVGTSNPDSNVAMAAMALVRELTQRIKRLPKDRRGKSSRRLAHA